jgi:hypothetical protein
MPDGPYTPGGGPKDDMRLLGGDTEQPFLLSDDEINSLYDASAGRFASAARVCLAMAAKLSSLVDVTAEGATTRQSQRSAALRALADQYVKRSIAAGEPGSSGSIYGAGSAGAALVCDDPEQEYRRREAIYHPSTISGYCGDDPAWWPRG